MDTTIFQKYTDNDLTYTHVSRANHDRVGFSAHTHDVCEILFLKSGKINCAIDGTRYDLNRNDLVIIPAFSIHEIRIDDDRNYERFDVLFDSKLVPFPFEEKLPRSLHILNFDGNDSIIGLFDKMDFYCEKLEGDTLRLMLTNLLQEICINILLETKNTKEAIYSQTNPIVSQAIKYIERNLLTLEGIDDICRELFITKSHLHHLFMKHLGITPKKYITSKRLAMAQREISFGAKPTDVYVKCGFSDYSTFYRAYKNQFGRPPSEKGDNEHTIVVHDDGTSRNPYSIV